MERQTTTRHDLNLDERGFIAFDTHNAAHRRCNRPFSKAVKADPGSTTSTAAFGEECFARSWSARKVLTAYVSQGYGILGGTHHFKLQHNVNKAFVTQGGTSRRTVGQIAAITLLRRIGDCRVLLREGDFVHQCWKSEIDEIPPGEILDLVLDGSFSTVGTAIAPDKAAKVRPAAIAYIITGKTPGLLEHNCRLTIDVLPINAVIAALSENDIKACLDARVVHVGLTASGHVYDQKSVGCRLLRQTEDGYSIALNPHQTRMLFPAEHDLVAMLREKIAEVARRASIHLEVGVGDVVLLNNTVLLHRFNFEHRVTASEDRFCRERCGALNIEMIPIGKRCNDNEDEEAA